MTPTIETLRDSYFLREHDPDFATGRRTQLVYAVPSMRICFTHVNQHGPEPLAYLEFANRDIGERSQRGAINALGNAKRAVHLVTDTVLEAYGLAEWLSAPFPARAEVLRDIGAFPTRMVSALNRSRNLMEHEYICADIDQVADFVELAELFVTVTYPFFREGVIGAYVGVQGQDSSAEWRIDRKRNAIVITEIEAKYHIDCPFGRVHYDIRRLHACNAEKRIPLTRAEQAVWTPYLELLVYCTRRGALRLPVPDQRGGRIYYRDQQLCLEAMPILHDVDPAESDSI
jgi:hypothetical protein